MRLKQKLMLGPWITTAMLLVVVATSAAVLYNYSRATHQQQSEAMKIDEALDLAQAGLSREVASLYRTMTIISSISEAKVKAQRGQVATRTQKLVQQAVESTARIDDPKLIAAAQALTEAAAQFVKAADMALDMGSVDPNIGVAALQSADRGHDQISAAFDTMFQVVRAHEQRAEEQLRQRAQLMTWLLGALSLITAAVALGVAWTLQRRILRDVQRVSDSAARVADGWLEQVQHDGRSDEIGELLRSQSTMVERLREMVTQVSHSAHSIRTSSTEVASGNADLSQRTEQAAANLQRTASSMEQLTGTVRQSADSAAQANQLASSASASAQRGGVVMQQVVSNMQDIANSSKRIADIIGTIDGIAFQTNILALNAAVEAARAGEQGRGFAVVAGEVRSLAQRSAEAAKEIKGLIGDSVQKVESGTALVHDAGTKMTEIVAGVQRVTDIIGEISSAAKEQTSGIEQVNTAVNELEQMTQQNAALVEQSAAAAESLKDHAHKLASAVQGFKLEVHAQYEASGSTDSTDPAPTAHAAQARSAIEQARQRSREADPKAGKSNAASATAQGEWESF